MLYCCFFIGLDKKSVRVSNSGRYMNMTKDLDLGFSYRLRVWHRRLLEKSNRYGAICRTLVVGFDVSAVRTWRTTKPITKNVQAVQQEI